jgi:hypothetical protein
METAVLKSRSKNDLKLLLDLAKKIGIDVRLLTNEEAEETGLFNAIKSGRTGKIINTKRYLEKLRKG